MESKAYILGVDDEFINRELITEVLKERYEVACVADGAECLQIVADRKPDLILIDVNMPQGMDGLETCRSIQADEENLEIPIIFMSSLASLKERKAIYKAGGEGYLTKPLDPEELLTKVELTLKTRRSLAQLRQAAEEANSVALSAMTTSGEMGEVLRFLQESFSCSNYQSLLELVLSTLKELGLEGVARVAGEDDHHLHINESFLPSLEMMILKNIYENRRIMTLGKSTIFTSERAVIMVHNMPIDDEESFGRLKDILAMMIDSVDARVAALQTRVKLAKREKTLADLLESQTKKSQETQAQLEMEAMEANKVALSAMTTSGELGEVLRFLQDSFFCEDYKSLVDQVFDTLEAFGLEGAVCLINNDKVETYTRGTKLDSEEQAALDTISLHKRIMNVGASTIFTAERVLILVRDIADGDQETFGRLKDILATMIVSVDARAASLETNIKLLKREKSLADLLEVLEQSAAEIRLQQAQLREKSVERFSRMIHEIEDSFNKLGFGLSEEQEHALMKVVAHAETDILALSDSGFNLEKRLARLAKREAI
ncbi:MAG: response regulator [Magnetococcales bacterium]|nr:response regulator [Magnetococcales bacterium]